jgi:hypothetical protein
MDIGISNPACSTRVFAYFQLVDRTLSNLGIDCHILKLDQRESKWTISYTKKNIKMLS